MLSPGQIEEFQTQGRVWLRRAISSEDVEALECAVGLDGPPGRRLELSSEFGQALGSDSVFAQSLTQLGVDPDPVRLVAFNKTDTSNWGVPWHQDRVVAVTRKADVAGYSNWMRKPNYWHCEAPESLLDRMIFVRVHLDDVSASSGPLELALGSHKFGSIRADQASEIASQSEIELCLANAGDVLLVHALCVHRSKRAESPQQRRTLRVDYAPRRLLADQLCWAL